MSVQPVLINGAWRPSQGTQTFQAVNPATQERLPEVYPVSPWSEIEEAILAAKRAFAETSTWTGDRFVAFLERYADRIDAKGADLVALANAETALPVEPRLAKAELPRTTNQLRQAAAAARDGSWLRPIIDSKANIRSIFGPIGPVVVFGPNNFPFAFNGISGGDFAAAVAAGCPVIAKGHSSHPGTTRLFAVEAHEAARETGMPAGFVQLIYRTAHADGEKLVSHPAMGATGYTGARETGLVLKAAADRAGKPIYLELSSINPVVVLPGAIAERGAAIADEFTGSCLMGTGQFCTNPGLVLALAGDRRPVGIDRTEIRDRPGRHAAGGGSAEAPGRRNHHAAERRGRGGRRRGHGGRQGVQLPQHAAEGGRQPVSQEPGRAADRGVRQQRAVGAGREPRRTCAGARDPRRESDWHHLQRERRQ
jgi:NADP-dependent aldehyde dehydrogenase